MVVDLLWYVAYWVIFTCCATNACWFIIYTFFFFNFTVKYKNPIRTAMYDLFFILLKGMKFVWFLIVKGIA